MEINYIALFVADLDRACTFYREVLEVEFPYPAKNGGIEGRSGLLRLGLYERKWLQTLVNEPPIAFGKTFLLALSVENLDHAYARLVSRSVTILQPPATMSWGQRVCFFTDPDGNLLELVEMPSNYHEL